MGGFLAWVTPYKWLALGAIFTLLGGAIGLQTLRLAHAENTLSAERLEYAKERAQQGAAIAKASEANRVEEQRRQAAAREIEDAHAKRLAAIAADRNAAAAAARGLSDRVAALVNAARQTARNPAVVASSAPAPDAFGMLADVLSRLDARVELIAAVADGRGAAGEACVREYESLTPSSLEAP